MYLSHGRIAFALAIPAVFAQKCYYPNGKPAPDVEKPCSSAEGSACCPDNWECLDNGLCYYPPNKLWGRYSCTDQNWKSPGCPSNMCTYQMSNAVGGESITQCADHDNQWCCNGDAQHVNCCKESPAPRPFFALADGKAYATVGASTASSAPNLATITGKADGVVSNSPSKTTGSNSPQSTDAANTTPTPSNVEPSTTLQTSVSSGTAGLVTFTKTVVTTPASTAPAAAGEHSSEKSKLPLIVGCAVGVPLGLALLGILIWLLRKRSRQSRDAPQGKPPFADEIMTEAASPYSEHAFVGGAKHSSVQKPPPLTTYASTSNVPELDNTPVGPARPISMLPDRAELDSGTAFQPGAQAPHSPHVVGIGGGNGHSPHSSWGSTPNRYSGAQAVPSSVLAGYSEADGRPISTAATGLPRPLSGAPPGGYVPYRPNNLAPREGAAELSTVKTPPA